MTTNQLRYLSVRGECKNEKEAAEMLGLKPQTVYNWPDTVREAFELMLFDGVLVAGEILRRNLPKAAAVKVAALDSEIDNIRQHAATEVLDRGLGKPTQRQELSGPDGGAIVVVNWDDTNNADDTD